ncbi:MAG TPA: primosome assembly protein PriA [Aeromicrobium sp.]|nr:primosome assembly protein PriA [Aeromicrobium sp.]
MIARVVVDSPLPHLDRLFDYDVPAELIDEVALGCRVKVRFAGRLVDAFVLDLVEVSEHQGTLAPLAKVVSSERVLAPAVAELCRTVADRWAGTLSDVLRLAVPPRQARVEAHPPPATTTAADFPTVDHSVWLPWPGGPEFLSALAGGGTPRVCWSALPAHDPAEAVAQAVLATLASGRAAVVCVPDNRDLERWDAVFTRVLGEHRHVVLSAAQKPADRYRSFLSVARGTTAVVLGTRAAAYAPVANLGLVAMFDDGDDLFAEPRAPYAHAREVLLLRALQERTAVLLGGYARSVEAQALVEQDWCSDVSPEPVTRRRVWPTIEVSDGDAGAPARLPRAVFKAIRGCSGPVLVQVPRRGYRTSLACQACRTPARCAVCGGPLEQAGVGEGLRCRWCATEPDGWACAVCGGHEVRAPTVGHLRTAEEYAAAFSDRTVVTSGGSDVLDVVDPGLVMVLATPGAEPPVEGGYELVVLMDTWLMLVRDDVRVVEEAHRRWFNALALARETAPAVVVGEPGTVQALVRADPVGLAQRELAVRSETHLPPIGRLAAIDGPADVLDDWAKRTWTLNTEVLGPIDVDGGMRLVLRAPRREGAELARLLHAAQSERSAAKLPAVRVRIDPMSF